MRIRQRFIAAFVLGTSLIGHAEKKIHEWKTGRVLDENRARYFAGMLHNSSSSSSEGGSWNGTANSNSYGDTTSTSAEGTYSGTRTTSTSGSSIPIYRVYDNLVIEGDDSIYITSERLRWRWSKSAHVSVNGTVQYYVQGRKLHVLDDDQKEHTIDILQTVLKNAGQGQPHPAADSTLPPAADHSVSAITFESIPPGGDIEVDGAFVGNTPSVISIRPGTHEISVTKKGFSTWSRTLNAPGGNIHVSAELEPAPQN